MSIPIARMKKAEIVKLASRKCLAHSHSYLEHYRCFEKEVGGTPKRVGFLDVETSNLDADFGIILSWCILTNTGEMLEDVITKEDIDSVEAGSEDKRIVSSLVDAMKEFDLVVTFYGARFDLPFIRTRALVCKVPFLEYGTLQHKDLWFLIRGKMKLSSNRLENATRVLLGKTKKTRIESKYWRGGVRGDKKSLDFILDHNRRDVRDLSDLYYKVIGFGRPVEGSI